MINNSMNFALLNHAFLSREFDHYLLLLRNSQVGETTKKKNPEFVNHPPNPQSYRLHRLFRNPMASSHYPPPPPPSSPLHLPLLVSLFSHFVSVLFLLVPQPLQGIDNARCWHDEIHRGLLGILLIFCRLVWRSIFPLHVSQYTFDAGITALQDKLKQTN